MTDLLNPLISVVMPTFNHAQFLRDSIGSVVAQTYSNWKLIIVNNFSTDETVQIVESFEDPRISLINYQNHGIIAAARNQGIQAASGELIAFLDSDDLWYPNKLSMSVQQFLEGNEIICHGELWVEEGRKSRKIFYGPRKNAEYQNLLRRGNCISTSAVVVRTSLIKEVGGFDQNAQFVTAEDYDLWLKLTQINQHIVFIPEILGEFRRHSGNASNSVLRNLNAELAVVASHFANTKQGPFSSLLFRQREARAYYGAARGLFASDQLAESFNLFRKSLMKSPFVIRTFPGLILLIAKIIRRLIRKLSLS